MQRVLDRPERETVVNFNDDEQTACVYSAQRKIITKLKKNPAAVLVEEGVHDGSAWARFEIPKELISFRSKTVKLELTEEERQRKAERLRESLDAASKVAA
jgi:hypothetical protein